MVGDVVTAIAALFCVLVQSFLCLRGQVNSRSLWCRSVVRALFSHVFYPRVFASPNFQAVVVIMYMYPPQLLDLQARSRTYFISLHTREQKSLHSLGCFRHG
jgi:hypothetical protein